MSQRHRVEALGKFMAYILAHRPDEYGLLPDAEGFVDLKDLRQAINEEEGWGFVRESHLQEVVLTDAKKRFEIRDGRIRATFADRPILPGEPVEPPKVLYCGIRRRAYPVVLKRGLLPSPGGFVVLTDSRELAERMGRRRDPKPLILEVQAGRAWREGIQFFRPYPLFYLTGHVPPSFLWGPPLEKVLGEEPPRKEAKVPSVGMEVRKGKDWKREARKFRRRHRDV